MALAEPQCGFCSATWVWEEELGGVISRRCFHRGECSAGSGSTQFSCSLQYGRRCNCRIRASDGEEIMRFCYTSFVLHEACMSWSTVKLGFSYNLLCSVFMNYMHWSSIILKPLSVEMNGSCFCPKRSWDLAWSWSYVTLRHTTHLNIARGHAHHWIAMEASYSRTMHSIILEKMLGNSFRNTTSVWRLVSNLLTSQSDRASAGCARRMWTTQVTPFNLRDPLAVLEYQTPRDVSCSLPSLQTSFGGSRRTSRI